VRPFNDRQRRRTVESLRAATAVEDRKLHRPAAGRWREHHELRRAGAEIPDEAHLLIKRVWQSSDFEIAILRHIALADAGAVFILRERRHVAVPQFEGANRHLHLPELESRIIHV
jgi:hypothetical protein